MRDVENALVRHIVGTSGVPEIREPESSRKPSPAVLIKGSIAEIAALAPQDSHSPRRPQPFNPGPQDTSPVPHLSLLS